MLCCLIVQTLIQAIENMGVGSYAEERENAGIVATLFINPEAASEGL